MINKIKICYDYNIFVFVSVILPILYYIFHYIFYLLNYYIPNIKYFLTFLKIFKININKRG